MEGPVRDNRPGGGYGPGNSADLNGHVRATARGRSATTKRYMPHVLCTCTVNIEARQPPPENFLAYRTEKLD
jgi:hypothetical protein